MQFRIRSTTLAAGLSKVAAAADAKIDAGLYKNVKIEVLGERVRLYVQGMVIRSEVYLPDVESDGEFSFGVSHSVLSDIVSSLPDTSMTATQAEAHIALKTDRCRFKLNVLEEGATPPSMNFEKKTYAAINFEEFMRGLDKVAYAADTKSQREYATVIYVDDKVFAATDGFRVAIYPNKALPVEAFALGPLLLVADSVPRLKKIFSGLGKDGGFQRTDSEIILANSGVYASLRLAAKKFTNFRSILPKTKPVVCEVKRRDLIESLRRVMIVQQSGIKYVDASFADNEIVLQSEASDFGQGGETVGCKVAPIPELVIRFNGEFLVETLQHMDQETVQVEIRRPDGAQKAPLIVTDGEHINVLNVISTGGS